MIQKRQIIILTILQKKVRKYLCALVDYGMEEKELINLGGYTRGHYVRSRIRRCKVIKE